MKINKNFELGNLVYV